MQRRILVKLPKLRYILIGLFAVSLLAWWLFPRHHANTTLPSGKQININSIVPMHFSNGGDALVLTCETDISIDDKQNLRKEVDEIWSIFKKNVEAVNMTNGVIRITHSEGSGPVTHSKGFGFVFVKVAGGQWHCLQDDEK
jgi:hypothetical protein